MISPSGKLEQNTRQRRARKQPNLKLPKAGKTHTNDIHARLKQKSPWFRSIENPKHGADCKVPDATGVETGTIQLVQKTSFTVNTNGVGGMKIHTPYPNKIIISGVPNTVGLNMVELGPTQSASGLLNWGWAGDQPWGAGRAGPFGSNAALQANADAVRIVSASISAMSEASGLTNQGQLVGWVDPYGIVRTEVAGAPAGNSWHEAAALQDYKNHYNASFVPLNTEKGLEARWFPVDKDLRSYTEFYDPNCAEIDDPVGAPTRSPKGSCPIYEMGVIAQGAAPNTVIIVEITVNYEFLINKSITNIVQGSPSPSDAKEEELVLQWVQDEPSVKAASPEKLAASPLSVEPSHDDRDEETGGFGMFVDVLKEVAPIALGMLELI